MSATTAQSTESLASPLSWQVCSSWLLSACSPCPRSPSPPSAAPVPPPPPRTWKRTTITSPTRPSPPPPTATPRPPPSRPPPPRRSWTLEMSRFPPSRYLISATPRPGAGSSSEDLPVGLGHREAHLHRAVHLLAGRRGIELRRALEPCHRRHGPRDSEATAGRTHVADLEQRREFRAERRGVVAGAVHGVPHRVEPRPCHHRAVAAQPPVPAVDLHVVQPAERDDEVPDGLRPPERQPGVHRGDRLAGRAAVAHLQVHRDRRRLGGLHGVAGGGHDRHHLGLPGGAPLERRVAVPRAGADGHADVRELRLHQQVCLTADGHLRNGTA